MFYSAQQTESKEKYKHLLQVICSLSRLYSDSDIPYLYYRVAENIFCLSFNADNHTRDDTSVDASKGNIGIGLKTFLQNNGRTFQKIAEFNALRPEWEGLNDEIMIRRISGFRNYRLSIACKLYGLENLFYHCVTRSENRLHLVETKMNYIESNTIENVTVSGNGNTISFNDRYYEYSFNKSKSTLFKRFITVDPLDIIPVLIIQNPLAVLSRLLNEQISVTGPVEFNFSVDQRRMFPVENNGDEGQDPRIIFLPLYAPSSRQSEPALSSGLNQWNARGRPRHPDEVYIPIPSWIHTNFPSFFSQNRDDTFNLILPNREVLNAKLCQQGRKGLMSNPNRNLGRWLLREVLMVPEGELVTRNTLIEAGIDSVRITKIDKDNYQIDFCSLGHYERFKNSNR